MNRSLRGTFVFSFVAFAVLGQDSNETSEQAAYLTTSDAIERKLPDCSQWGTGAFSYVNLKHAEHCLNEGADPNDSNEAGMTPLHWAAKTDADPTVFQALIALGADVNATSTDGTTPLHFAVEHSRDESVQVLIDADADVNARSNSGMTPLFTVKSVDATISLLAAGANVRVRNEDGQTALHWLSSRIRHVEVGIFKTLTEAGLSVNARDELGGTPLHDLAYWSAFSEHVAANAEENCDALVSLGADVDAQDEDGNTPLHWSVGGVLAGQPDMVSGGPAVLALLNAGADATITNSDQQTPWDLVKENEDFKAAHAEAFWRLNDARFESTKSE